METGLFLGIIGWVATMFMWWHLPKALKRWSLNHFVITDVVTSIVTFYTMSQFSKSIASMVATVIVGLLMNLSMMALGNHTVRAYLDLVDPEPIPLRQRLPNNPFRRKNR